MKLKKSYLKKGKKFLNDLRKIDNSLRFVMKDWLSGKE